MSTSVVIHTDFSVTVDEYVKYMREPELHDYLRGKGNLTHFRQTILETEEPFRSWKVDIGIREQIPSFLRAVIDTENLHWTQTFLLNKETGHFTVTIKHPFPASVIEARGEGSFRDTEPGKCRFHITMHFKSRLPAIGGKLEAAIAERTRANLQRDMGMRQEYMAERKKRDVTT